MAGTGNVTREGLIDHIVEMNGVDHELAKKALRWYSETLPHMKLVAGVKERLDKDFEEQRKEQ